MVEPSACGQHVHTVTPRRGKLRNQTLHLLVLRNPWGNQDEWLGKWSDRAAEWNENKEVAEELAFHPKADGLFHMAWEDFATIFDQIEVCCMPMPSQRAAFHEPRSAEPPPGKRTSASEGVGGNDGSAAAKGSASVPRASRGPYLPRTRPPLPKVGLRLKFPGVMIEPTVSRPEAPFQQYLEARLTYLEACRKAEERHAAERQTERAE